MVIALAREHQRRIKQKLQARPDKLAESKGILFNFELFCFLMLRIKNKQGKVVPLELNAAQRRYAQSIQ
ncbi:hypothetical protein QE450_004185 [Paenibacillus sp. SORGH_AS306]|uniref:hypothetical protein n=1 Tax=unclassified Paenibacillus TaxID=185978 RepID=UPI002783D978|nr:MULTISPECIES: hypothetical protein [unclassified Paenibacillus]MDQ1236687.1 hypothetical protein [Paenibacillus sp. SORGH_AS_0306]MDR6109044.1 hypothetical protein [Paenibacillus sp. SORGH_AS_0338]